MTNKRGWLPATKPGWVCWALVDTPESAERLRNVLLSAIRRPLEKAGLDVEQVPGGASDAAFEAREELAAQLLRNRRSPRRDLDGTLREYAARDGVELPSSRSVPNLFHRALTEPGARMMVGGVTDVAFGGLMDSWEATWPEGRETIGRIRAAHREAELAGVDLMAQSPMADGLRGLMRFVEQTDDRLLCAAVRACTRASGTLAVLWTRAVENLELVHHLMADVMWDQWVRVGGLAPNGAAGEAAVAISTVQYLAASGWADDLHRFQNVMDNLLDPGSVPRDSGRQRPSALRWILQVKPPHERPRPSPPAPPPPAGRPGSATESRPGVLLPRPPLVPRRSISGMTAAGRGRRAQGVRRGLRDHGGPPYARVVARQRHRRTLLGEGCT
ncbi:hypothetical protein [Streptomyces sp. NPDC046182]|uniref:hypothetical protein n=1 Tax=Streptomyces sp. NPDC046182 TaxID=3154601 RepID=UPI0033FBB56D